MSTEKSSHVAILVILSLLLAGISYSALWSQTSSRVFFNFQSNKSLSNKTQNVTKDTQHVTNDTQQATEETQHVTNDTQHVTNDTQQATEDTQHVTNDTQHVTNDTQQATEDTQQVTEDTQHVTKDKQHVTKDKQHVTKDKQLVTNDLLQIALEGASMKNKKTVIISVVNKAYAEENGMLDLFLQSLRIGKNTEFLINHLLLVAADQIAYDRCKNLRLHCHKLITEGIDFSSEALYATDDFLKMMWRRTLFLGEVLKRGYSFIFTDMDVIWLRNPFGKLGNEGEDMQISSNWSPAGPFDESNPINTGFFFVTSNNKTISLFDAWYEAKNTSGRMKEQDVLQKMINDGINRKLGLKMRFLNDLYFGGFCGRISSFKDIRTMHANCCRTVKAKLADLKEILQDWKSYNKNGRKSNPKIRKEHKACANSWKLLR